MKGEKLEGAIGAEGENKMREGENNTWREKSRFTRRNKKAHKPREEIEG